MKLKAMLMFCAALAASVMMASDKPAIEGAELGKWTMDIDAAKALAAETGKPIFMNFTGSDWCGWCQLMDKNIFSKAEWKDYAKENLVLVWIDFPKKADLVPEKFRERNQALGKQYKVEGFPTYIVLDADGTTELGQLSADPKAKPLDFAAQVEKVLVVSKLETLLSAEDYAAWKALDVEEKALEAAIIAWQKAAREEAVKFQKQEQAIEEKRNAILEKVLPKKAE